MMTDSNYEKQHYHFEDLVSFADNDFASVGGLAISVDRKHIFNKNIIHNHDFYELAYIRCGDGVQIINGISYTVTHGDVTLFCLQDSHTYYSFNDMEVINCCFRPDFLPMFTGSDLLTTPVVHLTGESQTEFEMLLNLLHDECRSKQEFSEEAAQHYLQLLIIFLKRNGYLHSPEARRWNDLFLFLSQNYSTVSLEDAARKMHFSKNYFCRAFREKTGSTFMSYINHIKITAAIEIITYTDFPISEIWNKVGFRQAKQFYTLFKRETGLTPMQFRTQYTEP